MKKHKLEDQAVEIKAISLTTDNTKTFSEDSLINLAGADMSKRAAEEVFKKA